VTSIPTLYLPLRRRHVEGQAEDYCYYIKNLCLQHVLEANQYWLTVDLKIGTQQIILSIIYFNPSTQFETRLEMWSESMDILMESTKDVPVLICGDLNVRIGNLGEIPNELTSPRVKLNRNSLDMVVNRKGKQLMQLFDNFSLFLLNGRTPSDTTGEYTFIQARGDDFCASVLDLVAGNCELINIVRDFYIDRQYDSDHRICVTELQIQCPTPTIIPRKRPTLIKYSWNAALKEEYKAALDRSLISTDGNVEDLYLQLKMGIHNAAKATGMIKFVGGTKTPALNKPWFDNECKTLMTKKRRLLRTCKRIGFTEFNTRAYICAKKELKLLIEKKKKAHARTTAEILANVRNTKMFWNAANNFRRRRQIQCPLKVSDWEEFYSRLNTGAIVQSLNITGVDSPSAHDPITYDELNNALAKIKTGKSPGNDRITSEFLKNLNEDWTSHLLKIYNKIMTTEVIPQQWSLIETIMLYKGKGSATEPENYRGISLVQNITKLFTQILLTRIEAWAEENDIIPEFQTGFRRGRGCMDNIFTLSSTIFANFQRGNKIYVAFVDFARAFDSIEHNKLWTLL